MSSLLVHNCLKASQEQNSKSAKTEAAKGIKDMHDA